MTGFAVHTIPCRAFLPLSPPLLPPPFPSSPLPPPPSQPLYRDMKKTSNIEAYVEWFNRLSYLVATEICVSDKKRNRAKLVEFFLDAATECKRLNNFNSFMAISGECP